ncbi:MAG: NAD(P)-binding protein [Oceanicoccus sp.]|uniref:NAD(P)/FAD-dependent oxidoreductase n=1 Tax=Oceanicoccus sp. TaxID=2691044 RepID=UPI002633A40E|nr:FAD-dependent oxidoreductase [Oceanicoccus sp.]MCP3907711.1 NAD(P)-binding protein [Oceanicoccus sp.]MDG1772596.1 FAD-dependent oxidoreductase [Oceanicoccus sp.]
MKIAVIGSGISGLSSAYLLQHDHEITVFESEANIGGHTATMDVTLQGKDYAVDTGFIVYNDWTYPNFIRLMDELGVQSQPTEMSFSVSCDLSGLEYGGNNLNTLFAQRRNIFSPSYLKMIKDILRFNKESIEHLESGRIEEGITLGEYLKSNGYGETFANKYLIPMGSAIWSASTDSMFDFPLLFFVRFFKNHGLLSVNNRPQWRVIKGGSREYLQPLTAGFKDRIRVNSPVASISRDETGVDISLADGSIERFDQVIVASHSDQALSMLNDATVAEKEVLGAIPYQKNDVVLHTDASILPNKKLAWSSWNYWLRSERQEQAILTYNMNILQGIEAPETFCVTLNATESIDSSKILGQYNYSHPVFSLQSVAAAERWGDINGVNRTWFCGAYWANGFHEDGASSGIRVAKALGAKW